MWQRGFGSFVFVGLSMLLVVTLAFDLLRVVYRFLFGYAIPSTLVYILIALSLLVCAVSFTYRYVYEGHEVSHRPTEYFEVSVPLQKFGFIAFFSALVMVWYVRSQWWGLAWVSVYTGGEILISAVSDKRLFATRLGQAKIWFPEMTLDQQAKRAREWTDSGMEPVEYEMKLYHSQKSG